MLKRLKNRALNSLQIQKLLKAFEPQIKAVGELPVTFAKMPIYRPERWRPPIKSNIFKDHAWRKVTDYLFEYDRGRVKDFWNSHRVFQKTPYSHGGIPFSLYFVGRYAPLIVLTMMIYRMQENDVEANSRKISLKK